MSEQPHFTTRRGFIALAGFGGTSLYGLWAAYGAAPNPVSLLSLGHEGNEQPVHERQQAHQGLFEDDVKSFAEFEHRVRDFIDRYALPDGSVYPPLGAVGGGHGH